MARTISFVKVEEHRSATQEFNKLTEKGRVAAKSGAKGIREVCKTWGKVIGIVYPSTVAGEEMFKIIKRDLHHDKLGYSVQGFCRESLNDHKESKKTVEFIENLDDENPMTPDCDIIIVIAEPMILDYVIKSYLVKHFNKPEVTKDAAKWFFSPPSNKFGRMFDCEIENGISQLIGGVVRLLDIPYIEKAAKNQ